MRIYEPYVLMRLRVPDGFSFSLSALDLLTAGAAGAVGAERFPSMMRAMRINGME